MIVMVVFRTHCIADGLAIASKPLTGIKTSE